MQLSFSLNDVRDGNRFQILAHRFGLTNRELAILVIKKFLNDYFWEWNIEELYGKNSDDLRIQGFIEYLDENIDRILRSTQVAKDFRKPEKQISRDNNNRTTRTTMGEGRSK